MKNKVTAFLPCRAGSERVPHKNIKTFAGFTKGLIEIKLHQLLAIHKVDEIVLSTNDKEILDYANKLNNAKIRIHKRSEELSSSATSTDQLIGHALELIPSSHILWTHVTSPFITEEHYNQIIDTYFEQLNNGYDSLMTTTPVYGFFWRDEKPFNYDPKVEKWPRTQTLKPLQEVNSGAFLAASKIYNKLNNRIGEKPYLYELDKITSYDIDWPEDFVIAEHIAKSYLPPPLTEFLAISKPVVLNLVACEREALCAA